jgi:hypothetical protein
LGDARGIVPAHRHGHQNGQKSWHILHCRFVFCHPGSRLGNTERLVAQQRCLVALWKPWIFSIGQCVQYRTIALSWLSKWPATEVHLIVVVTASFVWWSVAKRPCYGPFKLTPSYYINLIGVISLWIFYWPPLTTMDAVLATIVASGWARIWLN